MELFLSLRRINYGSLTEEKVGANQEMELLKNNLLQNKRKIHDMTIVTSKNHRNQTLKKVIEKLNFKDQIVMEVLGVKLLQF